MKEGIWGWWMIVLGLMVIGVIMLVTDMTTSSEQNYYMTKQVVKASMEEAVDYAYYAKKGKLRISSEKFMENFIRRYAEIITINKTTKINFYDIYEMPPKVTVEISTTSSRLIYGSDNNMLVPVVNKISAILETTDLSSSGGGTPTPSPGGGSNSNPTPGGGGGGTNLCPEGLRQCTERCKSLVNGQVECWDDCEANCAPGT